MAIWLPPAALSHAFRASTSPVIVLHLRSSLWRCPSACTQLRQAIRNRLWTSKPLHRGYRTSIPLPPDRLLNHRPKRSPTGRLSILRVSSTCFRERSDNELFFQTPKDNFALKLNGLSKMTVFCVGIFPFHPIISRVPFHPEWCAFGA